MEKYWEGSQEDQHEQGLSLSLSLSLSPSLSFITFACEEESSLTQKIKQAPDDDQMFTLIYAPSESTSYCQSSAMHHVIHLASFNLVKKKDSGLGLFQSSEKRTRDWTSFNLVKKRTLDWASFNLVKKRTLDFFKHKL